jgi:transcriptional regulator with XRE-family HTH domain
MVAYAKTSTRAEKRALREKMRAKGLGHREIAAELARRYRLRPRAAWREAYGWSLKEAAARINAHSGEVGLDPGGIAAMTAAHLCEHENWPGHGPEPSGRRPTPYLLALLAAVYGCDVTDLIDLDDREHLPPADLLILDKYGQNRTAAPAPSAPPPVQPSSALALSAEGEDRRAVLELLANSAWLPPGHAAAAAYVSQGVTYRWMQEPDLGGSWIEREVRMAAHEGSDHAEQAERRDIGEMTLEQLRADVIQLSRDYMTAEPFTLFLEMRRVRSRMYAALDRRLWPRDQAELYFLLGCLSSLMASAANALGYPQSAEELVRAGWAYASVIDHRPLMAYLRLDLANTAYWANRHRQCRDLAQSGLRYIADGPTAAMLHLKQGRASARLGDAEAARQALAHAEEIAEHEWRDDLVEIGGDFDLSRASQHYLAGSALIEIPGAEDSAAAELETATSLYAAGPGPGEVYGYTMEALARIELATARLRARQLDAAIAAMAPVLALPSAKRIASLAQRLGRVRAELARPHYQGSAQAQELDEQVEDFGSDTIVSALHDLPASPS